MQRHLRLISVQHTTHRYFIRHTCSILSSNDSSGNPNDQRKAEWNENPARKFLKVTGDLTDAGRFNADDQECSTTSNRINSVFQGIGKEQTRSPNTECIALNSSTDGRDNFSSPDCGSSGEIRRKNLNKSSSFKSPPRFTHFVSVRLNAVSVREKFESFKKLVLVQPTGFESIPTYPEELLQNPRKLHLTICMLSLNKRSSVKRKFAAIDKDPERNSCSSVSSSGSEEGIRVNAANTKRPSFESEYDEADTNSNRSSDIEKAVEVLREALTEGCRKLNLQEPIRVRIGQPSVFGKTSRARVLFVSPQPLEEIQLLSEVVNNQFQQAGLTPSSPGDSQQINLHVTLMNSVFVSRCARKNELRQFCCHFNAENLLNLVKDLDLGEVIVDSFEISSLTDRPSPDGYYHCAGCVRLSDVLKDVKNSN